MKKYMVSYDLVKPGKDYTNLINRLKQHGAVKILLSQWVIRTTWTAAQLRDDLQQHIDSNDRLLVTGLTGEAAWTALLTTNDTFKSSIAA